MATVILDFEFNGDKITQDIAKLTAELIKNKERLAESRKEYKDGAISVEEYSARQAIANARTKELTGDIRGLEKQQQLLTKANKASEGSYDQLNAQYQLAQRQLKELEGTLELNEDGTRQLSAEYFKLSKQVQESKDALDNFGDGISDSTSRVGQYEKAIDNALEKQKESAKEFKEIAKNTKVFGVSINDLEAGFKGLQAGIKGGVATFKTLKGAIAATGIGLLLVAFGALQTFLTRTKRGIELLDQVTAGFGAVVGVISDQIAALGELLIGAFTNPLGALKDLANFIVDQFIGNLKGLAGILEGIITLDYDKIKEGFDSTTIGKATKAAGEFAAEVGKAAQNAANLEARFQRLRDAQRELSVETARQNVEIDKLRKTAEDVSISEQERIANLTKANKLIEKQAADRLRLAKEEFEIIKAQNAISDSSVEDLEKEAEAQRKVFEIERELGNLQSENASKIANLQKQADAKRAANAKAEQERQKKAREQAIKDQIALTEVQILQAEKGSRRELELRKQLLEQQRQLALANFEGTQAERQLIIAKSEAEILALQEAFDKTRQDKDDQAQAKLKQDLADLETFRRELEIQRLDNLAEDEATADEIRLTSIERQRVLLIEQLEFERNAKLENEKLTEIERQLIREQFEADRENIEKESEEKIVAIKKESQDKITADAQKQAQARLAFEQAVAQSSISLAKDVADFAQKLGAEVEAFNKAIALTEIGINLQKELSAISLNASANPANAVTFGAAGATQFTALSGIAIARAALSAATVLSFQDGGLIDGKPHSQGGVPAIVRSTGQPVELEGQEFIVNRVATRENLAELERINNSVKPNGVRMPNVFEQGGRVSQQFAANAVAQQSIQSPQQIKVDLRLSDLAREQQRLGVSFNDASL